MTQATEDERKRFWRSGMRACPRCGGGVALRHEVEGCRMDGDAYGRDEFACRRCPFVTSFAFDDQCNDGTPYYYETWTWER